MAVLKSNFWSMLSGFAMNVNRCFREKNFLHIQGQRGNQAGISKNYIASRELWLQVAFFSPYSSTVKKEVANVSETLRSFCSATRQHISKHVFFIIIAVRTSNP
jgi:hypothetical protein